MLLVGSTHSIVSRLPSCRSVTKEVLFVGKRKGTNVAVGLCSSSFSACECSGRVWVLALGEAWELEWGDVASGLGAAEGLVVAASMAHTLGTASKLPSCILSSRCARWSSSCHGILAAGRSL